MEAMPSPFPQGWCLAGPGTTLHPHCKLRALPGAGLSSRLLLGPLPAGSSPQLVSPAMVRSQLLANPKICCLILPTGKLGQGERPSFQSPQHREAPGEVCVSRGGSRRISAGSHATSSRSGKGSSEPRFLPSLPARGLAGGRGSGACVCSATSEQGEGGGLRRGFCSPGLEGSFTREGNGIDVSSGEKMLHPTTSRLPRSLASDTVENHNSIKSVPGSDRPCERSPRLLAAPVRLCGEPAGMSVRDAWEHRTRCSLTPGDRSAISPRLRTETAWQPGEQ